MEQEFYISQIFEYVCPAKAAAWCNKNNAEAVEIEPITKTIEEQYLENVSVEKEVVIPAVMHEEFSPAEYDDDGNIVKEETFVVVEDEPEHTETVVEEVQEPRIRTFEKTIRRFQIQERPAPTTDEKQAAVREVRDRYINDVEWRVSRYRDQKDIEVETTDTEETFHKILQYMQYLRDYPESSVYWYEHNPMTWDEYKGV